MKITPRNGLVTVRSIKPRKDTMIGKILIPVAMGNQFQMAEIIEVGRGSPDFGKFVGTEDLKKGQIVLVKSGVQIDLGQSVQNYITLKDESGFDLWVLNQQDIMAIIEDSPDEAGIVLAEMLDDGLIEKNEDNEGENTDGTD